MATFSTELSFGECDVLKTNGSGNELVAYYNGTNQIKGDYLSHRDTSLSEHIILLSQMPQQSLFNLNEQRLTLMHCYIVFNSLVLLSIQKMAKLCWFIH